MSAIHGNSNSAAGERGPIDSFLIIFPQVFGRNFKLGCSSIELNNDTSENVNNISV